MKSLAAVIALVALAGFALPASAAVHTYAKEATAQKHCPNDIVVYGAAANRVYHMQGDRYYGNMKAGRYVCQIEADKGGWHQAPNGQ